MTIFNEDPDHGPILPFKGWDRVRNTSECPHCKGTGLAPQGSNRRRPSWARTTECGFCNTETPKESLQLQDETPEEEK